jgi:hypothetical protein
MGLLLLPRTRISAPHLGHVKSNALPRFKMSLIWFAAIIEKPQSAGHLISGFIGAGGATGSPRMAAISSFRQRCRHNSVIGVRPAFGSHLFSPPRLPFSD